MRVSEAFPSNYLTAADLQGQEITVKVRTITMEEIGQGERKENKPVVYFQGKEKGLVLNKTNATNISLLYGDEMNSWIGAQVVLFMSHVDFQGRTVEAIRVRPLPQQTGAAAPQPAPMPDGRPVPAHGLAPSIPDHPDDDIPF